MFHNTTLVNDVSLQTSGFESKILSLSNISSAKHTNLGNNNNEANVLDRSSTKIKYAKPLMPEEIRWFYKEDKVWIPFCGYDSLRLEKKYLQLNWKSEKFSDKILEEMIIVRGDLYEVDVFNRKGYPIYWKGDDEYFEIIRGTWFKKSTWHPVEDEQFMNHIEMEHMEMYGNHLTYRLSVETVSTFDSMITNGVKKHFYRKFGTNICSTVIDGYHVDWYDQDDIYYYTNLTSKFSRYKFGWYKVGTQIVRGYKDEARVEDKLPDIIHMVFVIHGIGQKLKGGCIVEQTEKLRSLSQQISQDHFPKMVNEGRVEFFPVEWRKNLTMIDDTIELITLSGNKNIRDIFNSSVLDILYYCSPLHKPDMVQSLRKELGRIYDLFLARTPHFNSRGGKVSVLAHSLGSILMFDILTGWSPTNIYQFYDNANELNEKDDGHDVQKENLSKLKKAKKKLKRVEIEYLPTKDKMDKEFEKLNFQLDNLFCIGSPIGLYIALRGYKPKRMSDVYHIIPQSVCGRLYNIFHPSDPLAYRMEPLIHEDYCNVLPVNIYRVTDNCMIPYNKLPLVYEFTMNKDMDDINTSWNLPYTYSTTSKNLNGRIIDFWTRLRNNKFIKPHKDSYSIQSEATGPTNNDTQNNHKKTKQPKDIQNDNNNENEIYDKNGFNDKDDDKSNADEMSIKRDEKHKYNKSNKGQLKTKKKYRNFSLCWSFHRYSIRNEYQKKCENKEGCNQLHKSLHNLKCRMDDNKSLNQSNLIYDKEDGQSIEKLIKEVPLKYRIDFQLAPSRYGYSSYLSVLTAHTSYWTNPDMALFILSQTIGYDEMRLNESQTSDGELKQQ